MTSSPVVPAGTARPSGSKASTAQPRQPAGDLAGAHGHERGRCRRRRCTRRCPRRSSSTCTPEPSVVHPAEAGRRQRCARSSRPQRSAGRGRRCRPALRQAMQERCRGAEHVAVGLRGEPPQRAEVGVAGIAVEQHDRGADQQAGHQVVPHHPAGGGEPGEAVAGAEVLVEGQHLEVLDGDAAVAVDDGLGQAGGARS